MTSGPSILSLLTEADGRSEVADALKILSQSISLTGQCSFFILPASSISAGSADPLPPVPSLTTLFHGFLADAHERPVELALLSCCTQRDRGSGRWIRCWSWNTVMLLRSEGLCSFNCSVEVLLWAFIPTAFVHFSIIQINRPLFLKMIEKQTKDPKIIYNPVFQRWSLLMYTGQADLRFYLAFTKGMSVS